MKVLLFRPNPPKETIGLQHLMICEPLELEYLVANIEEDLRDHFTVKIIDLIVEKKSYEEILREEDPDYILFTGYITHVGVIKEMAEYGKKFKSSIITGVGGVHAEVVPEDFQSKYIDFIFKRNGIDGFNESLWGLVNGLDLEEIRSILEEIPPKRNNFPYKYPARDAVARYRKNYYYMFHNPSSIIKTSYGCPFNCSFCFCKEITDGSYFTRPIEDVINELETIPEEEIYIVDDDFLYDVNRLKEFMSLLRARNIRKKFLIYGRADFIAENGELLRDFKDHGLQAVIVGIESVRKEDLQSYNKGTTIEINEAAIRILQALDIELYATLIIPMDFSKSNFKELSSWLRSLNVRFVNLQPLTPLPGTGIFNDYTDHIGKTILSGTWPM